jgi:hypothetical protein
MKDAKKGKGRPSRIAALAAAQAAKDADADVVAFAPDGPDPVDAYAVSSALADAALAAALPGRLRARLAAGAPVALVLAVPDASWVKPTEDAIRRLSPAASVVARDGRLRSQNKPGVGSDEVAASLADGRPTVGVAPTPEAYLPSALVSCADARLDLAPPSRPALRRLLRKFARGPVPRRVGPACASLTFDEILASVRPGASAREVLAAFARARARKSQATASDSTPPLDSLPGFSGEARRWSEDLVDAMAQYREGKLPWKSLSASALLAGPPGTGKTLFIKSLAKSMGVTLVATSVGQFFATTEGNLGDVVTALQRSFDLARASAPSLYFLDELDALPDRASLSTRGRDWWLPVINHALTLFDGATTDRSGIVLCAASNFPNRIDGALLRRFERVLYCPLPDDKDLSEVAAFHLGGALSPADLLPAVRLGLGASAADAARWARDAAAAARADGRPVSVADVAAAVAPPDPRSPDDLRRAAVHESGHCVAALATGLRVESCAIVSAGASGGRTTLGPPASTTPTARHLDDAVVVALAGRASEDVIFGAPSGGAEGDLAQATATVAAMLASRGLGGGLAHVAPSDEASGLVRRDPALRRAVERRLGRLYAAARALVEARRGEVEAVADALVRRRLLTGAEVASLVAAASGRAPRAGRKRTGGGHDA